MPVNHLQDISNITYGSMYRHRVRRSLIFLVFSLIIVATGVLSPHFAWGHLPVSPRLGQTIVIIADFFLLFAGFRLYVRDIRREESERRRAEKRLVSSFRYIGVANRKLEILTEFVERISLDDNPKRIRERVGSLLPEVAVSLLGVDVALLRLIDKKSNRTVTEWWYENQDAGNRGKIRIRGQGAEGSDRDADPGSPILVRDTPDGFSTIAVLAADKEVELDEVSHRFLQTMVRFMHIVYAFRPDSTLTFGSETQPPE